MSEEPEKERGETEEDRGAPRSRIDRELVDTAIANECEETDEEREEAEEKREETEEVRGAPRSRIDPPNFYRELVDTAIANGNPRFSEIPSELNGRNIIFVDHKLSLIGCKICGRYFVTYEDENRGQPSINHFLIVHKKFMPTVTIHSIVDGITRVAAKMHENPSQGSVNWKSVKRIKRPIKPFILYRGYYCGMNVADPNGRFYQCQHASSTLKGVRNHQVTHPERAMLVDMPPVRECLFHIFPSSHGVNRRGMRVSEVPVDEKGEIYRKITKGTKKKRMAPQEEENDSNSENEVQVTNEDVQPPQRKLIGFRSAKVNAPAVKKTAPRRESKIKAENKPGENSILKPSIHPDYIRSQLAAGNPRFQYMESKVGSNVPFYIDRTLKMLGCLDCKRVFTTETRADRDHTFIRHIQNNHKSSEIGIPMNKTRDVVLAAIAMLHAEPLADEFVDWCAVSHVEEAVDGLAVHNGFYCGRPYFVEESLVPETCYFTSLTMNGVRAHRTRQGHVPPKAAKGAIYPCAHHVIVPSPGRGRPHCYHIADPEASLLVLEDSENERQDKDSTRGEVERPIAFGEAVEDTEVDQTEVEDTEVDNSEVEQTDVDDTEVEQTDVGQTDVEDTETKDTGVDHTDVDNTEVEQTDLDDTDVEQTDVNTEVEQTDMDQVEMEQTDVGQTDVEDTEMEDTDVDHSDVDNTEVEQTDVVDTDVDQTEDELESTIEGEESSSVIQEVEPSDEAESDVEAEEVQPDAEAEETEPDIEVEETEPEEEVEEVESDVEAEEIQPDVEVEETESDVESEEAEEIASDAEVEAIEPDVQVEETESDVEAEETESESDVAAEETESDVQAEETESESDVAAEETESDVQVEETESGAEAEEIEPDVQVEESESDVEADEIELIDTKLMNLQNEEIQVPSDDEEVQQQETIGDEESDQVLHKTKKHKVSSLKKDKSSKHKLSKDKSSKKRRRESLETSEETRRRKKKKHHQD